MLAAGGGGDFESNPPAPPPSYTNAGVVTTLAGSTEFGFIDGAGSVALFSTPCCLAVDSNGTIFVTEQYSNAIRKITAAGEVRTLAGSKDVGYQDGIGSAAKFSTPGGLAVDANGTVFVADYGNHVIRKISNEGVVTTFAGIPQEAGYADGQAESAQFFYPSYIAIDAANNLYISDFGNYLIRKISPVGEVTTIAGKIGVRETLDGTGVDASFYGPSAITVDKNGNLFVVDSTNMIRKISSSGVVTTLAGSSASGYLDGEGLAARFSYPAGLSADANGNLYVGEYNNLIRKVVIETGVVTTFAGATTAGSTDGVGDLARFNYPQGVAVGANGQIYVADSYNNIIRKIY